MVKITFPSEKIFIYGTPMKSSERCMCTLYEKFLKLLICLKIIFRWYLDLPDQKIFKSYTNYFFEFSYVKIKNLKNFQHAKDLISFFSIFRGGPNTLNTPFFNCSFLTTFFSKSNLNFFIIIYLHLPEPIYVYFHGSYIY